MDSGAGPYMRNGWYDAALECTKGNKDARSTLKWNDYYGLITKANKGKITCYLLAHP